MIITSPLTLHMNLFERVEEELLYLPVLTHSVTSVSNEVYFNPVCVTEGWGEEALLCVENPVKTRRFCSWICVRVLYIRQKKKNALTPCCYLSHGSKPWRENKQADICATWRGCGKVNARQVPTQQGGFSGGWYQKQHMEPNTTPPTANETAIRTAWKLQSAVIRAAEILKRLKCLEIAQICVLGKFWRFLLKLLSWSFSVSV